MVKLLFDILFEFSMILDNKELIYNYLVNYKIEVYMYNCIWNIYYF